MIKCNKCGSDLPLNNNGYCDVCGNKLSFSLNIGNKDAKESNYNSACVSSFVYSIVSIFFVFFPIFQIVSISEGVIGLKEISMGNQKGRGYAIAGIILSSIMLLVAYVFFLIFAFIFYYAF